ncbi:hypothetical protein QT972_00350 [Microcoleus sp. herbarium7]|uniref:hypothetical protein n=1 Tax=Microcoleus sp. herbarium7 TaxID=3055435 RepID=UPI002FD653F1
MQKQLYFFICGALAAHLAPRIITFSLALSKQKFTSNSLVIWLTAAAIAFVATFGTSFVTSRWRNR